MSANLFDLSGKVALVTGGSRGLGLQMVRAFADNGADVIICSRKIENCEEAAAEVRAKGRRALAHAAHVGTWSAIDGLIDAAYKEFGRVDILVNNAGMSPRIASHEMPESLFDSVVNLNFKGPFYLGAQVAKRMMDGDGGVIINVDGAKPTRRGAGQNGDIAILGEILEVARLAHQFDAGLLPPCPPGSFFPLEAPKQHHVVAEQLNEVPRD